MRPNPGGNSPHGENSGLAGPGSPSGGLDQDRQPGAAKTQSTPPQTQPTQNQHVQTQPGSGSSQAGPTVSPKPLSASSVSSPPFDGGSGDISGSAQTQTPALGPGNSAAAGKNDPRSGNDFPVGVVLGGVIGGVGSAALLAGIGVIIFCLTRRYGLAFPLIKIIIVGEKDKLKMEKSRNAETEKKAVNNPIGSPAPPPSYSSATHNVQNVAAIAPPLYEDVVEHF